MDVKTMSLGMHVYIICTLTGAQDMYYARLCLQLLSRIGRTVE